MKLTIHTLAYDTRADGTCCDVFASIAALNVRLQEIIEQDIESCGDDEHTKEIKSLLDSGDINDAWDYWLQNFGDGLNTYHVDEHTIEVPTPEITAKLFHACQAVLAYHDSRYKRNREAAIDMVKGAVKEASAVGITSIPL